MVARKGVEELTWIIYTAVSAVTLSIGLVLYKMNLKTRFAYQNMILTCGCISVIALIGAFVDGSIGNWADVTNVTLLYLLVSAVLFAGFLFCFNSACSHGEMAKIIPFLSLIAILSFGFTLVIHQPRAVLWKTLSSVLLIVGIVILCLQKDKYKGSKWLLYSIPALIFLFGKYLFDSRYLPSGTISEPLAAFLQMLLSAGILLCMCTVKNHLDLFGKMEKKDYLFAVMPGILFGIALLFHERASSHTEAQVYRPIYCICLPVTVLAERIKKKKKTTFLLVAGLILAVTGLFGMMLAI